MIKTTTYDTSTAAVPPMESASLKTSIDEIIPQRLPIPTTDKSIPPRSIAKVTAVANIPISGIWVIIDLNMDMFSSVDLFGMTNKITRKTTTIMTSRRNISELSSIIFLNFVLFTIMICPPYSSFSNTGAIFL